MAAVHYGPRPVFQDTTSFEVHVVDGIPSRFPKYVEVEVIARLRGVRDFATVEGLMEQIALDIKEARSILNT